MGLCSAPPVLEVSGTEEGSPLGRAVGVSCWLSRSRALTLEALGGRLSEGKENVTHDGRAAHPRLGDDVEDAVDVLPQVLLQ